MGKFSLIEVGRMLEQTSPAVLAQLREDYPKRGGLMHDVMTEVLGRSRHHSVQERKGHINLRKMPGTPAGCPRHFPAGQTGVYRPVCPGISF